MVVVPCSMLVVDADHAKLSLNMQTVTEFCSGVAMGNCHGRGHGYEGAIARHFSETDNNFN